MDHKNLWKVDAEITQPDQTDVDANYQLPFSPYL